MKITSLEKLFWKVFEKDYKNEIVNTLHKENADVIMKQAKANLKKCMNQLYQKLKEGLS